MNVKTIDYKEIMAGKEKLNILIKETIKANKMAAGITWEECRKRFGSVVVLYNSRTLDAWKYFTKIYKDIPQEHRLKILLLEIYTYYHYNFPDFYFFLTLFLENETAHQRELRIKENKETLQEFLSEDNLITVYRGVNGKGMPEDWALSYTTDKDRAEWFSKRFPTERSEVIERKFHISQILVYTNDRNENEVIVCPPGVYRYLQQGRARDLYEILLTQDFVGVTNWTVGP